MSKKRKKKKKRVSSTAFFVLKTGFYFLLVLVISYLLVNYVFRRTVVHNVSMMETLHDGDNIIMDELSYIVGKPDRYDVICFKSYKEKELLIKRVIGLPNETVRIDENGSIFIDDREIRDINGLTKIENPGVARNGITLGDDEYFVVGDNRDESIDSRYDEVGNIKEREILGKAVLVFWPINRVKIIK